MGRAEELFERLKKDGHQEIKKLIEDRQSEELFLDFKQSANGGIGKKLDLDDRKNLAKAISGFGNSEGGIIVWGVECVGTPEDPADVAKSEKPISKPVQFKSWLEGAVSGLTMPPHKGVQHHVIPSDADHESGFVVSYILQSNHAPHQVLYDKDGGRAYYMRAGSSFASVPHQVLAGMFGRRPQADINLDYRVFSTTPNPCEVAVTAIVQNDGSGIARDIFINAQTKNKGNGEAMVSFDIPHWQSSNWILSRSSVDESSFSTISATEFRLGFGGRAEPLQIKLVLVPPFTEQLEIVFVFGCDGVEPKTSYLRCSAQGLAEFQSSVREETDKRKRNERVANLFQVAEG